MAVSYDSGRLTTGADERFAPSPALNRLATFALSLASFLIILITLRPFGITSDTGLEEAEGDIVNQIGFLVAGFAMIAALSLFADRRVLAKLAAPAWIAVVAILIISVVITPDPNATMRSLIFTVLAMVVTAGALILPRSEADFRNAFAAAALITLVFAYGSVLLVPDLAVHSASGLEAQHAGLWRGHFSHKNIAGPVMSVITMFGLYMYRSGSRGLGTIITLLGLVFVVASGSKTTLGFLPLAIFVVMLRPLFGSPTLVVLCFLAGLTVSFLLTVGSVLFEPVRQLLSLLPDGPPTFTGRTDIWIFSFDAMGDRPLFGHGLYNFWHTDYVMGQDENFEAGWDVRGIGNAHSNYVDLPLFFGFIGAAVILWAMLLAPLADYVRASRIESNRRLADFFMMVVAFIGLLSLMETFFFNRADPVWLLAFMAVIGLRLLARTRVG